MGNQITLAPSSPVIHICRQKYLQTVIIFYKKNYAAKMAHDAGA